VVPWAGLEPA